MPDGYRLFVNLDRTYMIRVWDNTTQAVEFCTRETPAHAWGPPTILYAEGEPVSDATDSNVRPGLSRRTPPEA